MLNNKQIAFFWSGGKDSARALYELQQAGETIDCLITTINRDFSRISMHGVREELLDRQAKSIALPLRKMYVSQTCTNEEYEKSLRELLQNLRADGITHIAYGDIFLEDLRAYREKILVEEGLEALFPLWKRDTQELAQSFIQLGFKTRLCCVNEALGESFAGAEFDQALLDRLPDSVDPCGENGEFHTFCYAGPIFSSSITFSQGETIYRSYTSDKGFWFTDFSTC